MLNWRFYWRYYCSVLEEYRVERCLFTFRNEKCPSVYGEAAFLIAYLILIFNVLNFLKPKPTETVTTDESGVRLVNWPQWFYLYLSLFFLPCLYFPPIFFCIFHNCPITKVYAVVCIHCQCIIEVYYNQTQYDPY